MTALLTLLLTLVTTQPFWLGESAKCSVSRMDHLYHQQEHSLSQCDHYIYKFGENLAWVPHWALLGVNFHFEGIQDKDTAWPMNSPRSKLLAWKEPRDSNRSPEPWLNFPSSPVLHAPAQVQDDQTDPQNSLDSGLASWWQSHGCG